MLQVTEELRVVEEILLLVLDTDNGEIRHTLPLRSRAVAFAGAALMDLALEDRIDTDLEHLLVSDRTPLGNDLLDPILADIARSGESPRDTASWITNLAQRSDEIREKALARLIERGILEAAPAARSSFPRAFPVPAATGPRTGGPPRKYNSVSCGRCSAMTFPTRGT